ncbi:DUF1788 domain-containing protein [Methanospirillum sp. J.3.6.1-F.2.7.3]|jgi:hypothetical protein|uniref:DUF1788 domain-containing protein n=1 Tax=Methanospirillum purgamenti TaxID=2834276 RepID=A0A8E7EG27_9EURY|nr:MULTISPECIES: DUF1788 domain-containing protein [Methanospirillum]MDX8551923.1 DUF1788 domain-containing protein [Methanospirillum hungatei]QVV87853.1 DUF1788 domain-containing protein [Methanospirillum sp. J.3.6.1-F.2.7.3]
MNTETRMELLKGKIIREDFLKARGLGNEIPFWIFDYPPEDEHFVRYSIRKIQEKLNSHSIHFIEIDLYELCLEIVESKISSDKINEFERNKGSDKLLKKLQIILKPENLKKEIHQRVVSEEGPELVLLTGIGKAWPLVRLHSILNNLQPVLGNTPLLAFYPGEYTNSELSLFRKFKDANYYRAFRMIDEGTV